MMVEQQNKMGAFNVNSKGFHCLLVFFCAGRLDANKVLRLPLADRRFRSAIRGD